MKKIRALFLASSLLVAISPAIGQNLHIAGAVKAQPLIYRSDDGVHSGCGLRVVFFTNVPRPSSIADISINLYNPKGGKPLGMAKALFSDYSDGVNKTISIDTFMMAKATGQAVKLFDLKQSEDKDALLSRTSADDALDLIMDFLTSKPTEIGFKLKGEKTMRIIRVTVPPLEHAELQSFNTCFKQIKANNQ
jgi:hypothetical protein